MSTIHFETKLFKIGSQTLLVLPKNESMMLPSRGMVMVKGAINGFHFQSPLESDGRGSHWLRVDKTMSDAANVVVGDTVELSIEPIKDWPEPKIPEDLKNVLEASKEAYVTWKDITPIARWDWIRWIRSTKNPETRRLRIEKTFSKFKDGKRRPCCFNRSMCTDPSVSNNGVLLEPTQD